MSDNYGVRAQEFIEMAERCKQEIIALRAQIERLEPRALAYDNIDRLLAMIPQPSRGYSEDLVWTIDKRLREIRQNIADAQLKDGGRNGEI